MLEDIEGLWGKVRDFIVRDYSDKLNIVPKTLKFS